LPKVQNIKTASKTHLGAKVSQEFRELGLNQIVGPPYNLRHSWARRTYEEDWNSELAARAMGHSLYLHEKVYHQFINQGSDMKLYKKFYKGNKE
jgi:integrase